jgi:hypothetical protein
MASQRKPSSGSKARTTKSGGAKRASSAKKPKSAPKKPAAAKKKTVAARKTTTRGAASEWTARPEAAAAKPPEPEPGELPERRKLGLPIFIALVFAAIAVAVVLILSSGGDNKGSTTNASTTPAATTPTTTTLSPTTETPTTPALKPTSPAPGVAPSKAPPTAKPAVTVTKCAPILGNGNPYPVTSSGPGTPAPCSEAHSVLIAALNDQATDVNGWNCVTNPSSTKVAVCTSGQKTVVAHAPA